MAQEQQPSLEDASRLVHRLQPPPLVLHLPPLPHPPLLRNPRHPRTPPLPHPHRRIRFPASSVLR